MPSKDQHDIARLQGAARVAQAAADAAQVSADAAAASAATAQAAADDAQADADLNTAAIAAIDHSAYDTHLADGTKHFLEGAIDHGAIAGLADDDHTIYLLADGTRDATGDLDMGGFDIGNIGTVDGVDVSTSQWRYTVNAGAKVTGASTGFVLKQAGGFDTSEASGLPLPIPQDCKLARVGISAMCTDITPTAWTLRLRKNGSGTDLATISFTPGGSGTITVTAGAWSSGAGSALAAGDRLEVRVDGASLNDLSVRVEFFLRMQ